MIQLIVLSGLFLANQFAQNMGVSTYFMSYYLDDLLCLPIILIILQYVHQLLNDEYYSLPISHITISILFISLIFEVVLPSISTNFHRDFIDIVFYSVGALLFYIFNSHQFDKTFRFVKY